MKKWNFPKPPFAHHKNNVFTKAALVADFIFQIGESPELRKPSKPVDPTTITSPLMKQKIKYVKDCLFFYRKQTGYGRGISAVQVGIPETFFVVYQNETFQTFINPKIIESSKQLLSYPEMCMSAYPIIVPTIRPAWVAFEYFDESGQKNVWKVKDTTADNQIMNRVFLHELDHMKGIINVDIVQDPSQIILESDPKFYAHAAFETV